MTKEERKKALTAATIGDHVKQTEYAIRGYISGVLADLKARIKKGEKMPFEKFVRCNIGNPLDLGQPCLSFPREVLAVAMCPWLLTSQNISADAKDRAKFYMSQVETPQALGAYTPSAGLPFVIDSVCKFIAERDGFPADPNTVFLTNGAGEACNSLFKVLLSVPHIAVRHAEDL
jgi:alanine transaminase